MGGREIIEAGSFAGLSRPWMGLHTIDTVRRDAAEKQIWFETKYSSAGNKAQVKLTKGSSEVIYNIDMEKDVIDKITFSTSDGRSRTETGEMIFTYVQEINGVGNEFAKPRSVKSYGTSQRKPVGMLWLMELAD